MFQRAEQQQVNAIGCFQNFTLLSESDLFSQKLTGSYKFRSVHVECHCSPYIYRDPPASYQPPVHQYSRVAARPFISQYQLYQSMLPYRTYGPAASQDLVERTLALFQCRCDFDGKDIDFNLL